MCSILGSLYMGLLPHPLILNLLPPSTIILGMGMFCIAIINHDIMPSLPMHGLTSNPIQ